MLSDVIGSSNDAGQRSCSVLIVDDDEAALDEFAEAARNLGYECLIATDAYSALTRVAEEPRIGIVITDLKMPAIDGISFLDELDARFASVRPLVAVLATAYGDFETVVEAMRFNARDFLKKPISKESLATVLRRATRTWNQLAFNFRPQLARDGIGDGAAADAHIREVDKVFSDAELLVIVKAEVRKRQRRGDFLDGGLFSDPSWDILLDLTSGKLENVPVPVSSACASTGLPLSTALRYVRALVDDGMVRRWQDPNDKRRDLLELEDKTMEAMRRYLATVAA